MRIPTLARRSVATLAATALLTTGGAALGLTTGVANAQTVSGITRIGGGQAIGPNNGPSGFQINGTDFMPSNQETVTLGPHTPMAGQGNVTGVVRSNATQCTQTFGQVLPDAHCDGPLLFDVNLSGVEAGVYDVYVTQTTKSKLSNTSETDSCTSCITVVSAGPATTSSVAPSGTSNGPLTIKGTNFANGARVVFYNTDAQGNPTSIDTLLHFGSISVPDSTTINGIYSADPGAGGNKIVRVFNADDPSTAGQGPLFVQPLVTGVSPGALGQGATAVPVTISGTGFNASTTVAWSDPKVSASGPGTVGANGASFTVPTSVASDTTLGGKTLTVKGTGGGFTTVSNALTVTAGPKATSVSPSSRGQGSNSVITVNGAGFTANTRFSFGQGSLATTNSANPAGTAAQVNLVVLPDAVTGPRTLSATNPDQGTATLANALTIVAKPVITQITPASGGASQAVPVVITGHDFDVNGATITISGTGITVGPTHVDSSTQISTTFTASSAAFGPRDVTVTNTPTQGTSTCSGCYGINSMSLSPATGANTGTKTLTFTGSGLDGTSAITLTIPGGQVYQGAITGANVACGTPAVNQACATFDLTNVATGKYTATAVTGSSTLTCTSCFTVAAVVDPAPTSATPNSGGQGTTNRTITIAGSNFSPGEDVTFTGTGITVSNVTYNSPTQLTAVISIAENAATGARGFAVKNIGDGRSGSTAANTFTVTAGPKVTATDTHQLGQNAVADVTLTGSGFQSGAVANFGPGTTSTTKSVTPTSLIATVTVADTADTFPLRDIRVANPDGGAGTLVGQFTVTPAPRITSIAPGFGKPGETKSVVISGSGFATSPATPTTNTSPTTCPTGASPAVTCPTVVIAGLVATVKTVSVDGTSMTADFAISSQSPISNPAAKVINPDRGQSVKLAAFRIATVPVAPINAVATVQGTTATVSWGFPTTANADGGSPLTGFVVDDGDASTNNTQTVGPNVRTATFSGLTAGKVYTFTIKAGNAVGLGPAATAATSQFVTSLTSRASKPIATAGDLILYTGKLTRTANGTGAPDAAIVVTLDPDTGPTKQFTTHTNAIGVWGFRFMTYYNMTVSAKFLGNPSDKASTAPTYRLGTFLRIVKKTPGNGQRVAHNGFHVTGYANYATAGRVVYLVRGNGALVTKTTLRSDRTFDFTAKLPLGTYYLQVTMAAGGGNLKSGSTLFQVNSQ
ncbi:MAG: cell shape determination protein CcmA [Frankiales bacterium]|nr:cell shape determination protein CcmA [Frankiales bacterium]